MVLLIESNGKLYSWIEAWLILFRRTLIRRQSLPIPRATRPGLPASLPIWWWAFESIGYWRRMYPMENISLNVGLFGLALLIQFKTITRGNRATSSSNKHWLTRSLGLCGEFSFYYDLFLIEEVTTKETTKLLIVVILERIPGKSYTNK
jgi:hypothetical protein